MIRLPWTLSWYIVRHFLMNLLVLLSTFSVLIIIIDSLELFRRSVNYDVPIHIVLQMAVLKFPVMGQKILPFIMMLTGVMTYMKLTRHQELTIYRVAGVSVWQFLMPSAIVAMLFGFFIITTFNPLAGAMAQKYETEEARYLHGKSNSLSVGSSGLWLRESNYSIYDDMPEGEVIIHARDAEESPSGIYLENVVVFTFKNRDEFAKRVDADSAELLNEFWQLKNVRVTNSDGLVEYFEEYFLETQMTSDDVQNSFASPETISFWQLPSFIETLQKSGFSAMEHRMHWHTILASPFLYAAMVFLASLFSLRMPRRGGGGLMITASVVVGFLVYFFINIVSSFGQSGAIPILLAAWLPIFATALASAGILLHLEDG